MEFVNQLRTFTDNCLPANLALFLRYTIQCSEMWATFYFHMYEMVLYFTAFALGQVAMIRMQHLLFASPWCYTLSLGLAIMLVVTKELSPTGSRVLTIMTVLSFAVSSGLNMAGCLKLVDFEIYPRIVCYVVFVSLTVDILGNFFLPFYFSFMEYEDAVFKVGISMCVLIIVLILLQVAIICVFFGEPRNPPAYKPFLPLVCLLYNLAIPIGELFSKEGRANLKRKRVNKKVFEMAQLKRRKGLDLTEEEAAAEYNWLDGSTPRFDDLFVYELKFMIRYWIIMATLPGIFIAFELRYSFWIFSIQRLNRLTWWDRVLLPTQSILSIQQLTVLIFIPFYAYILNPILRRTWINDPLRRMSLGALFILFACLAGVAIVYQQEVYGIRSNEPYFDQTKISVRNGLPCELVLNERLVQRDQQWIFGKTKKAHATSPENYLTGFRRQTKDTNYLVKVDENDFVYDKMRRRDRGQKEFVYPAANPRVGDTATFYIKVGERTKSDRLMQSMAIVPVHCLTEKPYNLVFLPRSDDHRDTTNMTLLLIGPTKITALVVPYTRPLKIEPGIRFIFANRTPVAMFQVWRKSKKIYDFPYLRNLHLNYYWFKVGDGNNLDFIVDNNILKLNYKLKRGGLYDLVFIDHLGAIIDLKLYTSEIGHEFPFRTGFMQYIFLGIADILFGVLMLRFLFSQTPMQLHFHLLCDWHLIRAISNAIIMIIIKCGFLLTFFWQVAFLSCVVAISIMMFFITASQYIYKFPPDMMWEMGEDYLVMDPIDYEEY